MKKLCGAVALAVVLVSASVTAAEAAPKRFTVSSKLSKTNSSYGTAITISGKVSGQSAKKLKGKKVTLQRKYAGGGWRKVKTAKIRSNRTYRFRTKLVKGGNTSYRVVKARSGKIRTGVSRARTTAVYKWIDLTTAPGVATQGSTFTGSSVKMLGKTYARGFQSTTRMFRVYNIHHCTTFATTVGFSDVGRSSLPSTAGVMLWPETHLVPAGNVNVHGPYRVTRDQVRNVRLNLPKFDGIKIVVEGRADISADFSTPMASVGTAVMANPQLRCNLDQVQPIPASWY